jgi:hypothetical protein
VKFFGFVKKEKKEFEGAIRACALVSRLLAQE